MIPILVYIEWCDAVSDASVSWHTEEEAVEWGKDDWTVNQAGYIVEENEQYIVIASKLNPQNGTSRYSGLLKIPKTWITKRQILTIE